MAVRVELFESRIKVHLNSPTGWSAKATHLKAERVERLAKAICPIDTGLLRASIFKRRYYSTHGPGMLVGSNLHYAILVHEGTGIFGPRRRFIVPRTKRAMVFQVKSGRTVFAAKVKGSPPRRFLKNALRAVG